MHAVIINPRGDVISAPVGLPQYLAVKMVANTDAGSV
jgi:hypothetical protein